MLSEKILMIICSYLAHCISRALPGHFSEWPISYSAYNAYTHVHIILYIELKYFCIAIVKFNDTRDIIGISCMLCTCTGIIIVYYTQYTA